MTNDFSKVNKKQFKYDTHKHTVYFVYFSSLLSKLYSDILKKKQKNRGFTLRIYAVFLLTDRAPNFRCVQNVTGLTIMTFVIKAGIVPLKIRAASINTVFLDSAFIYVC